MTIEAELYDGTVLEFKDGTSPAVIQQVVKRETAKRRQSQPSPMRNALGIFGTGIERGLATVAGLPNIIGQGLANSEAAPMANRSPFVVPDPALRAETESRRAEAVASNRQTGAAVAGHTYSPQEIEAGYRDATGVPAVEPTQGSGRVLQAAGLGAGAGVVAGPLGIPAGALSGAASQTAAEAGLPQWAQILAGVGVPIPAGVTWAAFRSAIRSTPRKIMQDALRNATPEQMRAAQRLMDAAQDQGTPLTVGEAVAGVSGGANNRLLDIQRYTEQSRTANPIMQNFTGQRPGQNRAAFEAQAENIAPAVAGQARTDVPNRLQEAAEAAMGREVSNMRGRTGPLYTAAAGDLVPEPAIRNIIGRLDRQILVSTGRVQQQLQEFRNSLIDVPAQAENIPAMQAVTGAPTRQAASEIPVMDIGRLDSLTKEWRDRLELPVVSASALDKETSAKIGPILTDLRTEMRQASPNFEAGAAEHARSMDEVIEPMQRSPLGPLSEQRQGPTTTADEMLATQRTILTPLDPKTTDPEMVRTVARHLQIEDPAALQIWQRTNLESIFDAATKQMQTAGAGEWGGARFALAVSANPKQAANLRALLETLPNGQQVAAGFDEFLAVLRAQGYRQRPGSLTAWNQQMLVDVEAGRIPIGLVRPVKEFQEAMLDRRRERNARALAGLLLDPRGAEGMADLAGVRANSTAGRFAFALVAAEYVRQEQMLQDKTRENRE